MYRSFRLVQDSKKREAFFGCDLFHTSIQQILYNWESLYELLVVFL